MDSKECIVCGKPFEGVDRDVCSWQCDEKRLELIRKKLARAIKNDDSHTKNHSANSAENS